MTPEMWTQVYVLLASIAIGGLLGLGCWYGLKQLPLEED